MARLVVRAVELSRSIVLKQVSIFERCSSIPRKPRICGDRTKSLSLPAASAIASAVTLATWSAQTSALKTVSAMYALDCHDL